MTDQSSVRANRYTDMRVHRKVTLPLKAFRPMDTVAAALLTYLLDGMSRYGSTGQQVISCWSDSET